MEKKNSYVKIKEITQKLEEGIVELFKSNKYAEYLRIMSRFHNYSAYNCLLIMQQKPDATYVASYDSWNKYFGRAVRRGEKGINIIAPSQYKRKKLVDKIDKNTNQPIRDERGDVVKEEVEITSRGFHMTSVFDISQTHGKELPSILKNLEESGTEYKEFLDILCDITPAPIYFLDELYVANGYYDSNQEKIYICNNLSDAQKVKTAVHEISHAILHDRDHGLKAEELPDRSTREVEAESVAYIVCSYYGIDTSDFSFGYIASWSEDKDLKQLKGSLKHIQYTASKIIRDINKIRLDKEKELEEKELERKYLEEKEMEEMLEPEAKMIKHKTR